MHVLTYRDVAPDALEVGPVAENLDITSILIKPEYRQGLAELDIHVLTDGLLSVDGHLADEGNVVFDFKLSKHDEPANGFGEDWRDEYYPSSYMADTREIMASIMHDEFLEFCVGHGPDEFSVFARDVPWFIDSTRVKIDAAEISMVWSDGFKFVIFEYVEQIVPF